MNPTSTLTGARTDHPTYDVRLSAELMLRVQGFLGWVAYLGAANAGVPLSIIVKNYGWNA